MGYQEHGDGIGDSSIAQMLGSTSRPDESPRTDMQGMIKGDRLFFMR